MNDSEDESNDDSQSSDYRASSVGRVSNKGDWLRGLKFLNKSLSEDSIRQSDVIIIDNLYSRQ